jgi:hypothetical protein
MIMRYAIVIEHVSGSNYSAHVRTNYQIRSRGLILRMAARPTRICMAIHQSPDFTILSIFSNGERTT